MKQTRIIAEFWSPLFAQMQVTYLTFIFLTLQTLTKLKTTFGRIVVFNDIRAVSVIFNMFVQIVHRNS
jgi:hypothetical protein